jgi:hypothetical protein
MNELKDHTEVWEQPKCLVCSVLTYIFCCFYRYLWFIMSGNSDIADTLYTRFFIIVFTGIQQYFFQKGRIDNIFTDSNYYLFTDCLDEVAKKFTALYNDSRK